MLPYVPPPVISLGTLHIHVFSLCAAAAILAARAIILGRARRLGVRDDEARILFLVSLLACIAGGAAHAWYAGEAGVCSFGAVLGASAGAALVCFLRRYSWEKTELQLDMAAFAVPFAACLGRAGCALAHDHRGVRSDGWLAVRFPEGSQYDLGLLDFVFLLALSAAFLQLDRRRRPPLFFLGLAAASYGAFRCWRESLDPLPHPLPWAAVCSAGIVAVTMAIWKTKQESAARAIV